MAWIVVLGVLAAFVYRVTTAEERTKVLRALLTDAEGLVALVKRNRRDCAPFLDALRARTRFAIVTPVIVALNVIVFVSMIFGHGALGNPDTLVAWGANIGPRTSNAEWWRLVTASFIHSGLVPLIVNMAALWQLGVVLESVVGRLVFALVYVAAGIVAGLSSIAAHPVTVSAGASGAIAGVYGLLFACGVWDRFRPSEIPIPLVVAKRLAPAAALFVIYNAFDGALEMRAELLAFVSGFVSGLVLTGGTGDRRPAHRLLGAVTAATAALVVAAAIPLRGIADIEPEIARVLEIEKRTVPEYRAAEARSMKSRTGATATALADLIEAKIMPELQAERDRLAALRGVPREQQHLIADADEYVRLRSESWRLRAQGLRRTAAPVRRDAAGELTASWRDRAEKDHRLTQVMLGRAEAAERTSLEVRQRLDYTAGATTNAVP